MAVDIGANDGTLLNGYGDHVRTVAVEPTNQAAKCREGGHRTWQAYFTRAVAADILSVTGPAKAVTACNVLAHVPDPHEAVAGIADLLDDEGVFVSENHDVHQVRTGQWDAVYHEHLRFWSPATFARLLACHGLEVSGDQAGAAPTAGRSARTRASASRGWTKPRSRGAGAARTARQGDPGRQHRVRGRGDNPGGAADLLRRDRPLYRLRVRGPWQRENRPSTCRARHIPVVDEKCLIEDQPAYALLLAWHLADFLIPKLKAAGYKGKFIMPLPRPEVIGG